MHSLLPAAVHEQNFFPNTKREFTGHVSWPELFCLITWILMKNAVIRHKASWRFASDNGACVSCFFPPPLPTTCDSILSADSFSRHIWELSAAWRVLRRAEEQMLFLVETRLSGFWAPGVKWMLPPFSLPFVLASVPEQQRKAVPVLDKSKSCDCCQ